MTETAEPVKLADLSVAFTVMERFVTVMVKEDVVAVAVLESVTRAVSALDVSTVGVPEMTPVEELSVRPGGSVPVGREKDFPPDPPEETSDSE